MYCVIICITFKILCDTYATDCITAYLCYASYSLMKNEDAPADSKVFHLRMVADIFEKSQALAKRRGISLAGLIRMLLLRELEADSTSASK